MFANQRLIIKKTPTEIGLHVDFPSLSFNLERTYLDISHQTLGNVGTGSPSCISSTLQCLSVSPPPDHSRSLFREAECEEVPLFFSCGPSLQSSKGASTNQKVWQAWKAWVILELYSHEQSKQQSVMLYQLLLNYSGYLLERTRDSSNSSVIRSYLCFLSEEREAQRVLPFGCDFC